MGHFGAIFEKSHLVTLLLGATTFQGGYPVESAHFCGIFDGSNLLFPGIFSEKFDLCPLYVLVFRMLYFRSWGHNRKRSETRQQNRSLEARSSSRARLKEGSRLTGQPVLQTCVLKYNFSASYPGPIVINVRSDETLKGPETSGAASNSQEAVDIVAGGAENGFRLTYTHSNLYCFRN